MKKPACILTTSEIAELKREGIRTMKVAYYMRLESGGVLELMRPISEPVRLYGDDPHSESAHMRYIFENATSPGSLTVLRRLDEYDRLAGFETYKDDDGVCFGDGPACVSIFHRNQYESGPVWVEDRGELLEFVVGEQLCGRGGQLRIWEPSEDEGDHPVWVDPVTGSKMTTND